MKIVSNMSTLKDIAKSLEMIVYELHLLRTSKQVPEGATPAKSRKVGRRNSWTAKEIDTLLMMRKKGCEYKEIADKLHRTESACSARYWKLIIRNNN